MLTRDEVTATSVRPARLSRRAFVGGLGAVVAAGSILPLGRLAAFGGIGTSNVTLAAMDREGFSRLVGHSFAVHGAAGHLTNVALTRVKDYGPLTTLRGSRKRALARTESFAVTFRAARGPSLDQGTYRFAHPQLGASSLFVVPLVRRDGAQYYEAVFNRMPASS